MIIVLERPLRLEDELVVVVRYYLKQGETGVELLLLILYRESLIIFLLNKCKEYSCRALGDFFMLTVNFLITFIIFCLFITSVLYS